VVFNNCIRSIHKTSKRVSLSEVKGALIIEPLKSTDTKRTQHRSKIPSELADKLFAEMFKA